MPNMDYVRWENTVRDMRDCLNHFNLDPKKLDDYERHSYYEFMEIILDYHAGALTIMEGRDNE